MFKNHKLSSIRSLIRKLSLLELPHALHAKLRAELSSYADLHALKTPFPKPVRRPLVVTWGGQRTYVAAAASVLLLIGGTQATFAAEGALPGDILYPVKVVIAEPVALAFSASGEEKATLSARLATRRVEEATSLSQKGKLNEKKAEELARRFESHIDTIASEADALEAKGEIEASLALRATVEKDVAEEAAAFISTDDSREEDTQQPEEHFSERIAAKTHLLAADRERLASAISINIASSTEGPLTLLKEDVDEVTLMLAATASSTEEATTTKENGNEADSTPLLFFKQDAIPGFQSR